MGANPTTPRRLHLWLLLFVLVNGVGLDLALTLASPPREEERRRSPLATTSHFTREYLLQKSSFDSWRPMRRAIEYLREDHERPVYQALFFGEGVKFQYAPTSLLLMEPFVGLPNRFFNSISWLGVLVIALLTGAIFSEARRRAAPREPPPGARSRLADLGIALLLTLSFYPLLRGYRLGQIQTWIDVLFCGVVWCWMRGWRGPSGALAGLVCVIKPQLGLLLFWGVVRRQWRFVAWWAAVAGCFGAVSLWRYGLEAHLDYLSVLSFLGRHGESYHANQSLNGLLHRALFNGNNLLWRHTEFPPFHAGVFAISTLGSLVLVSLALFFRAPAESRTGLLDLSVAALSFSMAAPVVWTHHYGIALPIYALLLPAVLASPRSRRDVVWLALSFALLSNKLDVVHRTALSHWNVVQSYVFVGALLLLWLLYRYRSVDATAAPAAGGTVRE